MYRTITDHAINGLNEALKISVLDGPGPGGACHNYLIELIAPPGDPIGINPEVESTTWEIRFQNGPIKETGYDGLSNEALLAVLIDRMRGFQSGQYACRENALALTHMEDALHGLQHRTRQRMTRGVEGTHAK